MPNPNPKTEQLALGRGKRPKLNNPTVAMRMSPETRQQLDRIAQSYDCWYGGKPWISGLLEKIGSGELMIVPVPPELPALIPDSPETNSEVETKSEVVNSKQLLRTRLKEKHYVSNDHDQDDSPNRKEDLSDTCMSRDPH